MCIDFLNHPEDEEFVSRADEHWSMPEFGPLTAEEVRDGILSVMASMTTACEKVGLPPPQFSISADWFGKIFGTP